MNPAMRRALVLAFALVCWIAPLEAGVDSDDGPPDTAPIRVRFQYVPQYFAQLIRNDPRYESIEALVDNNPQQPWYEIILVEKTGRKILYCNSVKDVDALNEAGQDAHYAAIRFTGRKKTAKSPAYHIRLRDSYGQRIVWRFIVNTAITRAQKAYMSPPEDSGFVLMYAKVWAASGKGTTLTIGERTERGDSFGPKGLRNAGLRQAVYATSLTIAEVTRGHFWYVNFGPSLRPSAMLPLAGL